VTRALRASSRVLACAAALACAATAARAEVPAARWVSVAALGGATLLDRSLADFRWDVEPRAAWGAQLLAGTGGRAFGARVRRESTVQRLGFDGGVVPAAVRVTSLELVARTRVARVAGTELALTATGGRVHVGYHPDHLTVPAAVAGSDLEVALAPLDAWTFGGGAAARHALSGRWSLGIAVERRGYGWEAARRAGDSIAVGHESFGDWNAHLELAWTASRR
jgi:hypothetical protein